MESVVVGGFAEKRGGRGVVVSYNGRRSGARGNQPFVSAGPRPIPCDLPAAVAVGPKPAQGRTQDRRIYELEDTNMLRAILYLRLSIMFLQSPSK